MSTNPPSPLSSASAGPASAHESPAPRRRELAVWLISHTRTLLPTLGIAIIARVANQLLAVVLLVVAAAAVVHAAAEQRVDLLPLSLTLVGVALAKALLRYLEHYAGHWVAFTSLQRLRELFFARLVPQAPAATTGRAGSELTTRATRDIDRIEVFFAHTLPPAVAAVLVPLIALLWLTVTGSPLLAGVIVPFLVLVIFIIPLASQASTWKAARRVAAERGALSAHLGDDIQGIREVLAFGIQQQRLDSLAYADRAVTTARDISGRVQALRTALMSMLLLGAVITPVLVGVASGTSIPQIVMAAATALTLWGPARGVDDFVTGLDTSFAATDRVRRLVEAPPAVLDPEHPLPLPSSRCFTLDAVTVRHASDIAALSQVSSTFDEDAWSFIVGASGSGKSTLASLLVRGRDPQEGTVRLGDADVRALALDDLRSAVAYVSQHPTVLRGTVASNLRLAVPDAADELLEEALRIVVLEDWALDTPLGERGSTVSGGQLQRLSLARALVAEPDVLVLDEALSQLDGPTARIVRERLAAARTSLTVIEITHRADLIPDEATVLVLDTGVVVEHGTAAELRGANGAFTRLEARADA